MAKSAKKAAGQPKVLAETVRAYDGVAETAYVLEAVYGGVLGYERLFELAKVVSKHVK